MSDEYNAGYRAALDGIPFSEGQSFEWQRGWTEASIMKEKYPDIDAVGLGLTKSLFEELLYRF